MTPEERDNLRERNRRRAHNCRSCGSPSVHELTVDEKTRRDDVFVELRYKTCNACGYVWRVK